MSRPNLRQFTEWTLLTLVGLGVGYFVFVSVSHAAGIWFALLPLSLFVNEKLVGRFPLAFRERVQTGVNLGYLAVLYLLLWGSR